MLSGGLLALTLSVQGSGQALASGPLRREECTPCEREWRIREFALAPGAHGAELGRWLGSAAWRDRADALEALLRVRALGEALPPSLEEEALEALEDAHPNVRARALALLGGRRLAPERARALASDPLPIVRCSLARSLAVAECEDRATLLLALSLDPDERVARAARLSLCNLEPRCAAETEAKLALIERAASSGDLLELGHALLRSPMGPGLLSRARALASPERGSRSILEALSFALLGRGEARVLIDGWIGERPWDPRRGALLREAARSAQEELAREALLALDALASGRDEASRWPGLRADRERLRDDPVIPGLLFHELSSLALDALGRERALSVLAGLELSSPLLSELLLELGNRRDTWDEEGARRWAEPPAPAALRLALVQGVARSFSRSGDRSCARLLARCLEDLDPKVAARAFESLCRAAEVPEGVDEALLRRWRALAPEEREARLPWFSRERPLVPFREEWIRLGSQADERRRVACELLAPFEGDETARSELAGWLAQDLAGLAASGSPGRELELRIQGELRSLARVAPAELAALEQALRASLGRSSEVGKVAAAALGRSAAGRARLEHYLEDGVDRRTRIEAAIALSSQGTPDQRGRGVAVLVADRTGAAWDLRERMIRALGAARDERSQELLRELALSGEVEPEERMAALSALAENSGAAATATLERAVQSRLDPETRRSAIERLGQVGGDQARAALAGLFRELGAGTLPGTLEERAVLRGALLAALGQAGSWPPEVEPAWLEGPLGTARQDLERRLRGEELAAAEFTWRGELALAASLAHAGRAARALEGSGPWARIDGRALVRRGAAARGGGEDGAARARLAAGVVALLGEGGDVEPELSRARVRLLALAWKAGRWRVAEKLAASLLSERTAGEVPEAVWAECFGTYERAGEIDPDARIASLVWQARARAALEEGALDEAAEALERSRHRLGCSRLALEEQRALEGELRSAREAGADR